ncbi:bifunctional nuclease 2-like [Coffea arabica]|uniref:Bifunctional nuclease 2-like n=1 Tax=Coffea arabica TaxID=13443 RepID=A0A6P6T514_COFAR|nr:bifunctional nuclease 2-like [Coffea arabica]XP_027073375.1 bifunctional nuclease 2-like [Coffea arabica]
MLGTQLNFRSIAGVGASWTDQMNFCRCPIWSSHCCSLRIQFSFELTLNSAKPHSSGVISGRKSKLNRRVWCMSSLGSFSKKNGGDDDDDYVEAILLISETISHHRMRMHGFKEERTWQPSLHLGPFSIQPKDPRSQVHPIGSGFLRRFESPTIFLKISCDGDFILPIIVGESAVEKLIQSFYEDDAGDCPNQYQLVRNLMENSGYEAKVVRITERVGNIYFSRIYFHKPGETKILSVDARPSDAINVAKRCKAPIYVNKQIVLADATRLSYGAGRMSTKTVFDVSMDSPADGPDLLSEELNMLTNMNLAAEEERYGDAALWRDKLMKLRKSKYGS